MSEQPLELHVDNVESGDQPLAPFPVEALDRTAQLTDGVDDIVALLDQGLQPLGQFPAFLFGAQVDGTEALALDPQPLQLALHLAQIGNILRRRQAGKPQHLVRLDIQCLTDAQLAFLAALASRNQPLLDTATLFAAFRQFRQRRGRLPIGLALHDFRFNQTVGCGAARLLRLLQFVHQRAALVIEFIRCKIQFGGFVARLFLTIAQGLDMLFGAGGALTPAVALLPDRQDAALPRLVFPDSGLRNGHAPQQARRDPWQHPPADRAT